MSKLKPITQISNEELLDLIKDNPNEISTFDYSNDILDFISTFGIKEGAHKVLLPLIYQIYKKWSRKPLHRNYFGRELSKLFENVKYGPGTGYFINKPKEFFLEKSVKKKQNKTKRKPWLKHFQRFILKFDIKSGRFYIKDVVLYNLYDRWVYKNGKQNPLSFNQFLKFCNLFFKNPAPKIINSQNWYSIDSSIQEHLTPDLINLMKQK